MSTAPQSAVRSAGFTFIEILVVMAIIGVLAGTVVLHSIGADRDRKLETEAHRIAALIELARGEAVSRNESWGLVVDETQYGFKIYDELDGSWRDAPNNTFRTRNAPPDVAFSLQVEGLSRLTASSDSLTDRTGRVRDRRGRQCGSPPGADSRERGADAIPDRRSDGQSRSLVGDVRWDFPYARIFCISIGRPVLSFRSGFTLIELMVALAIVAIVATTVLVRGGETGRANLFDGTSLDRAVGSRERNRANPAAPNDQSCPVVRRDPSSPSQPRGP